MLKKNQVVEVKIEEVLFPNKGIGYVEGQKITVKNVLKDQKVQVRISKKKKSKIEGKVLEVLENSSVEIKPKCVHFHNCGGCTYQNLPYEEQLKMKANQVTHLLDRANLEDYDFLGIEPSPKEYQYRNKMEFSFGDEVKGGPLTLGLHKQGKFYEIITTSGCEIVEDDFTKILDLFLHYFKEKKISHYHKITHQGVLRHLVVRKAFYTGEIFVNLVTTSQIDLDLEDLKEELLSLPFSGKIAGFLHTINDNLADTVQEDKMHLLYGKDYMIEKLLGLSFKISAFSFFQTNSTGAEKLYSIVRDFAGSKENNLIFDLYCGTGTIAQIMAPFAKKIIGIEIVEEAVEKAKENAALNGLSNCRFISGDVMEKVETLNEKPDLIILDPPRAGIHPKAIEKIIDFNPSRFIYVSCNPKSLANDLPYFVEKGYKIKKVKCMDMFPHTPHVECIVLIDKE